ncbi:unnamed protein product, partial [Staurois parvus]
NSEVITSVPAESCAIIFDIKKYKGCNIVSICIQIKTSVSEMDTNRYNVAVSILFNVKYNSGALCRDRRNVSAVIGVSH